MPVLYVRGGVIGLEVCRSKVSILFGWEKVQPTKENFMKKILAAAAACAFALSLAVLFSPSTNVSVPGVAVQAHYGSLPKGVMFEGDAGGMDPIKSIDYDAKTKTFTINGKDTYKCPIPGREFGELLKALAKDDTLGVSLTKVKEIVFGQVSAESECAKTMFECDKVMCRVIFGFNDLLSDVKLPGNYVPKVATERPTTVAAYTLFSDFQFAKKGTEWTCVAKGMNVEVYATKGASGTKAADGGHVIDEEAMKKGMIAPEDMANRDHIMKNRAGYMQIPIVAKTVTYAEAAAFARSLVEAKIDLAPLYKKLR